MIEETVRELAESRKLHNALIEQRKEMLKEFQNSEDFKAVATAEDSMALKVERLENTLRAEALSQYANDNSKSGTGYKVKTVTRVALADESTLKPWLLTNFTPGLKIDTKAVEKAAKAGSLPPELATVSEEPQVYIDADLSQFLKE